jgi:hypothetical protein
MLKKKKKSGKLAWERAFSLLSLSANKFYGQRVIR